MQNEVGSKAVEEAVGDRLGLHNLITCSVNGVSPGVIVIGGRGMRGWRGGWRGEGSGNAKG